jgi:beta-galactosidase
VLHFCGLGYSRSGDKPRPEGGATSDHFIDLEKLTFEPNFEKYVRDAFAPVGLMLDYWTQDLPAGKEQEFKVVVINDLYENRAGTAQFRFVQGDKIVASEDQPYTIAALGREVLSFKLSAPPSPGEYRLIAELQAEGHKPVRSVRDAKVVPAP